MRASAPALFFVLLLLTRLITQVDSAVNPLEVLRRNGGRLSWVVEIEVPDDSNEVEDEDEDPPIFLEAIIDADLDVADTAVQTRLSTSDDDSSSFPQNKILWRVEDFDEKVENLQSGEVQKSTGSPLATRIEHTATQGAKHNEDVEQQIESNGVQTESRHSINVQGNDEVLEKTDRTATQEVVPETGDRRSNTFPESKQLDVVQERLGWDIVTERSQDYDTPRSEGTLGQNGTEYTAATQKQVLAAGDRTSGILEIKPSVAAQNRTDYPDVQIELRMGGEAQGNEDALAPNGAGTSQMGIHHVQEDSNGTESSGNSSRREAIDSRIGNVSSQGNDESTTTETASHMVLEERQMAPDERQKARGEGEASASREANGVSSERAKDFQDESEVKNRSKSNGPEREEVAERQMVLEERQMNGGGGEASTIKEANEVLTERAKDLNEGSEVTNGSRSIGPEREKETSIGSEATVRRTNQERNSVSKEALETTQVAAEPTATSLQKEEVQRQVSSTTERAEDTQTKRVGTSRSAKDLATPTETDGVKSADNSTSGKGLETGVAARSLPSQDPGDTEVDSIDESPAKLTLTFMQEKREMVPSDAIPAGRRDYGRKRDGIRPDSSVPDKGKDGAGSTSEKSLYTDKT